MTYRSDWESFFNKSYPQNAANPATLSSTTAPVSPADPTGAGKFPLKVVGIALLLAFLGLIYFGTTFSARKKKEDVTYGYGV